MTKREESSVMLEKLKTISITDEEAPSLFSSLPNDIVLNVLARVPRRYYPIISCVSNKLQSLLRSFELRKTRSLMGKDCFYVCFEETVGISKTYHWFSLTKDRRLVSVQFPSPPEPCSVALMVGHEIYFVGGSFIHSSSSMWILDSRSGKLRQGPSSLVATHSAAVWLVDDKISAFGGRLGEIQAKVFDLKTQTWQTRLNPITELQYAWMSMVRPSLYARDSGLVTIFYDPRDGYELNTSKDFCVVDNVIYSYYSDRGLLWYNSREKKWRVVQGLKLNEYDLSKLTITEYNGKLAFLWHETKKMEFLCAMISLRRHGVKEIQGRVEWCKCLLSNVPLQYNIIHCLCRTD